MRVGAYGRISDDSESTGLGVERQMNDCESLASARRWDIAQHYIDNDLSAFKRAVVRPQFEQMLLDLASGAIDGIVVYDLDRFARQPRDLERAIELYEERKPSPVFASVQGDINLQSADGKTMARVMVAFANKASMDTGRRVARKHRENAEAGVPVGGHRPFGWKADKRTLEPREARAVRQAVGDLLAGVSQATVVARWNSTDLLTSTGKRWSNTKLRQYLMQPRLVGDRAYKGEVLEGVQGLWQPMLDRDTYDRLQALLATPERRGRVPRRGARHYLLTGVLHCGVCGGPMYGNKQRDTYVYSCKGEGHMVSASGPAVDRLVSELVLRTLEGERVEVEVGEWDGEETLAEARSQIEELMAAFTDKTLSGSVVFPRVQALEQDVANMQRSRAEWLLLTTGPASRSLSRDDWEALDTDMRRAHIEVLLEAVLVRPPATPRTNRFRAERLEPVWRVGVPAPRADPG